METALMQKREDNMQPGQTLQAVEEIPIGGSKVYLWTKRVLDIVLAAAGLLVLLIPMILVAIAIKLDSEGPAIYSQERLGKGGKPFMIYKFRSMIRNAEADGPCWAERDDDRCTRLGRFLRRSRIDELPQLVNILRGDMSFVGPRPERAYFYDEFERYIPGFRARLLVQPGMTGHAQVNGGYDLRPEEKIVYDMEYIRKRSFRMDLQCIIRTVAVVFSGHGAR